VAVQRGLVNAEHAARLTDREALDLIFLPGFTTATLITDISGRGVGMDVVRTNISELSGQVLLESQLGEGTTITLLLPMTLVTTRVVLVQVGTQMFGLPAAGCQGIVWVYQSDIYPIEGQSTMYYDGRTVPVVTLADLLVIEARPLFALDERMPAVLLGDGQRLVAMLVERIIDEREAVIKPVGPLIERQRVYSGAIQLGDGRVVLLLNPMVLLQAASGIWGTPAEAPTEIENQYHLLIADDSFTTRELVRSILQSAGYQVTAAVDGRDALDKLRTHPYDLVVSDVEMPRLDGFQLTASIRQELGLKELPVIIVTSLASDEHKRRGMEVGAQAYIVKSQFNQDNLLRTIEQLLGR
ncbi:MAG: response regulator, partial [Blastochloris sp.]|nr:response regulator [Blastochloris sp.]